jgi:hypothetical protein
MLTLIRIGILGLIDFQTSKQVMECQNQSVPNAVCSALPESNVTGFYRRASFPPWVFIRGSARTAVISFFPNRAARRSSEKKAPRTVRLRAQAPQLDPLVRLWRSEIHGLRRMSQFLAQRSRCLRATGLIANLPARQYLRTRNQPGAIVQRQVGPSPLTEN